jgi:hypothetical protein
MRAFRMNSSVPGEDLIEPTNVHNSCGDAPTEAADKSRSHLINIYSSMRLLTILYLA